MPKICTVASTEDSYEIPKNQILDAATLINDGSLLCYVRVSFKIHLERIFELFAIATRKKEY